MCELSGGIWERVCLVMSLKDVEGDEPSPDLSPLPLCVGHPEGGEAVAVTALTKPGVPGQRDCRGWPGRGVLGQSSLRSKGKQPCCSQGCRVTREVGSKQQKCRMQHAGGGGHPRAWVQGPAWGGSPPTAGMEVWAQNSFPHARIIWQIEPIWGGTGMLNGSGFLC